MTARQLLAEYRRSAKVLWREQFRHFDMHNCAKEHCELSRAICSAWCEAHRMEEALAWLLDGTLPSSRLSCEWREFFEGPAAPPDEVRP